MAGFLLCREERAPLFCTSIQKGFVTIRDKKACPISTHFSVAARYSNTLHASAEGSACTHLVCCIAKVGIYCNKKPKMKDFPYKKYKLIHKYRLLFYHGFVTI